MKGISVLCGEVWAYSMSFMFDELLNQLFLSMWISFSGSAVESDGLSGIYRKKEFKDKMGSHLMLPMLPGEQM